MPKDTGKMNIKEIPQKIRQVLDKLSAKTKKLILFGGAGIIIFAVVLALILNHKNYTVLYASVNLDEATEIVAKLQENNVDYQYKDNGDILVPDKQADQVRATLAQEGYPKSGFAYDLFIDNSGGMTTDSQQQTYKLYQLQNRIGATISLFEGVKDAKVTIALGEKQRYVLQDENELNSSSASVVVVMKDGGSPTTDQAAAIQRLVARSVAGMELENVAVFDGNGLDIGSQLESAAKSGAESGEKLARIVEGQITGKVMNVLGAVYGMDNVRVSVRSKINMEELIREAATYTTPEKIDEQDKAGIISKEALSDESGDGLEGMGGVTGAESTADASQYAGTGGGGSSSYSSSDATREYLVNYIKEQGQVPAGTLDDLTVSVAINGESFGSLNQAQLKEMIGNAAGIAAEDQETKIAVVSAPFFESQTTAPVISTNLIEAIGGVPVVIGIAAVSLLLLVLAVVLLLLGRKKKKKKVRGGAKAVQNVVIEEAPVAVNPEIANIQNEKARGLREDVRDFAEQNPEISAQLLKNWLNGGGQYGGGKN